MASATQLEAELAYHGTVNERGEQIWYQFRSRYYDRTLFDVRGTTRSCPVRVTMLDVRGRTLGQIIPSTSAVLPFLVHVHPLSEDIYYLRIDADLYAPCANGGYVFTLVEPSQLECGGVPPGQEPPRGPHGEPRECEGPPPPPESGACVNAAKALSQATIAVAYERALVARRHLSVKKLRQAESKERTARRQTRANCNT